MMRRRRIEFDDMILEEEDSENDGTEEEVEIKEDENQNAGGNRGK